MPEHTRDTSRPHAATLLFIIGPAGVGKSTCGRLLAQELGFDFIDLDAEFNQQIGDIQTWIDQNGYLAYCGRNTELFYDLVAGTAASTVYAISSGFLLYAELDTCFDSNAAALMRLGVSILLLPSDSLGDSTDIVVARLLQRRPWLDRQKEARKFAHRYQRYQGHGDIRVFSTEDPHAVALHMKAVYLEYLQANTTLSAVDSHHAADGAATIVSRDEDTASID